MECIPDPTHILINMRVFVLWSTVCDAGGQVELIRCINILHAHTHRRDRHLRTEMSPAGMHPELMFICVFASVGCTRIKENQTSWSRCGISSPHSAS